MGSSHSKPRKGHEHPKHLPKVGTPANLEWEHKGQRQRVFGSGGVAVAAAILVVLVMLAWLVIT